MSCVQCVFLTAACIFVVITRVHTDSSKTCGPEYLLNCSKPLSEITDRGLLYFSDKADLELVCPDLKEAIRCIHAYTRLCMSRKQRKHFRKLFYGSDSMVNDLCNNSTFQNEYLKYSACMKGAEPQSKICSEKYFQDMSADPLKANKQNQTKDKSMPEQFVTHAKRKRQANIEVIRDVCCSLQEYITCSTDVVRNFCGEEAAIFSNSVLRRMSFHMIRTCEPVYNSTNTTRGRNLCEETENDDSITTTLPTDIQD